MASEEINQCVDHETQVSEGGEADLHNHLIGCKKNPGHTRFIPVHTFTLDDLPVGHRDKDLYEYIKMASELTVKVDVKITSPHRPQFWINTNIPYPFYNMKEKTNLRTGSGMVNGLSSFLDGYDKDGTKHSKNYLKCWCKKCQHSDTASHMWWEFDVHTATHVVFDNIEAFQTTLRLFYDKEDSQEYFIDQVTVDDANVERDWCRLKCVTCDQNLAEKMSTFVKIFHEVRWKVWGKYEKSRDVDRLTFLVSHPHGCSKQVSVGHWVEKYQMGVLNKFTYTTCTCPGSSGARIHCIGYGDGWMHQLVHSGSIHFELNCSGTGAVL